MISQVLVVSLLAGAGLAVPLNDDSAAQSAIVTGGKVTASIPTTLTEGVEWLVPIQVANKTFNVQLDTGSADLWLFCTEGPQNVESGHNQYDPKSGTKLNGASFDINYGSGFAKGDVYTDKVTLGGITVTQAVECATSVDDTDDNDHKLDGILGVGFNSGGGVFGILQTDQPDPQMTLVENAFPQLVSGLFTADLNFNQNGVYNFGYIDQARFTTPITYMPVRNFNNWIVETSGYQIGNNGAQSVTWKALIDTGTTNVLLPPSVVDAYFAAAPQAKKQSEGVYYVPCDATTAALPNFTITFTPPQPVASFIQPSSSGGINTRPYNAVIPGKYFIGNPTGKNDGMCQGGMNNMGAEQPWDIILGDVFLMTQLVVFDVADPNGSVDSSYPSHGQIGFAPKPA
ncbi:hypothetical protein OIDMADRAFT_101895 [Oidiodendron maius Zn]|uniref:Peptidase A1 domain-containing protein n=1 Tax=Oidiodendron maius (strain Zn) TaxID=913774 RepID=A0A0C3D1H1_OIDMZ|nr:hypothetical protein OIDMADRAFT_101895 [Oidiodendron maius Zn]